MDDIKEGKRTLLTVKALQIAPKADKNFLLRMLGNQHIRPAEFDRCKEILAECGALKYTRDQAEQHVHLALKALQHSGRPWGQSQVQFLQELVEYLLTRTA